MTSPKDRAMAPMDLVWVETTLRDHDRLVDAIVAMKDEIRALDDRVMSEVLANPFARITPAQALGAWGAEVGEQDRIRLTAAIQEDIAAVSAAASRESEDEPFLVMERIEEAARFDAASGDSLLAQARMYAVRMMADRYEDDIQMVEVRTFADVMQVDARDLMVRHAMLLSQSKVGLDRHAPLGKSLRDLINDRTASFHRAMAQQPKQARTRAR